MGASRFRPDPAADPGGRDRREAGAVVTEYAIAFPVVLLLLLGLLQFAAWFLAAEVANGAAQEGARAARVQGGSAAAGHAAATQFLAQANQGGHLVGVQVTVTRGLDQARAQVTGQAQSLLPGLSLPVTETVVGSIERFRGDVEG